MSKAILVRKVHDCICTLFVYLDLQALMVLVVEHFGVKVFRMTSR